MRRTAAALMVLFCQGNLLSAQAEDIGGVQVTAAERKACGSDVVRLCRHMVPDVMAVFGCMRENRSQLSSACDKVARAHGL
jgi:hypothetical protein